MRRLPYGLALLLVSACAKGSAGESPSPSASVATTESTLPAAQATPAPAASATRTTGWKGGYKSVEGTFVLPKDVKWKVAERIMDNWAVGNLIDWAAGKDAPG